MHAADFHPQRSASAVPAEEPQPDELPGGEAYAAVWTEAERDGGRQWRMATDEERIRLVTLAAVRRRLRRESVDPRFGGIDAADLVATPMAALRWVVPDVLPEGTAIIASPPKIGKSCAVYQLAVETSLGGDFLGRRVAPGSSLYLALEDGARRGRDRLLAALAGRTMPRGRLEIRWSAPAIGHGLEADIARWLDNHPDATLVAIDTLGKVRARPDGKQGAYQQDVDDLGRLQDLFRDRSVALVVVHHVRKATDSDDFLTSVSGTYGISGSADTIITLKRKRLEAFGTLNVTGRDVPDAELSVRFDGLTWHEAPATIAEGRFERAEVYGIIQSHGPIFPKAIGDRIGKDRTAVQHLVDGLVRAGAVSRTGKGYVQATGTVLNIPPHSPHSHSEISEGGDSHAREDDYPRSAWDNDPEPAA